MHPYFIFMGHRMPSYGLMITLAAVVGIGLSLLLAKQRKYPLDDQLFAALYALAGVLVGGSMLCTITVLPDILNHADVIFANFKNVVTLFPFGIVFYGGLIGGIIGGLLYFRRFKANAAQILECATPAIPLAHAIGRIGCFLAGCCYGHSTDAFWGIVYPPESLSAPSGIPLVPVPLLEAALNVCICIGLFFYIWKKPRRGLRAFGGYLIAYAIGRFALEYLRGDLVRGFLLGISTSQLVSLLLLPVGLLLIFPNPIMPREREKP